MNITLVYNPKSGTALPLETLREKCNSHGIAIKHAVDITDGFPANLAQHIAPGAYIAAIGGDGTLNSVAQEVYDTEAIFVPLPGGHAQPFHKRCRYRARSRRSTRRTTVGITPTG